MIAFIEGTIVKKTMTTVIVSTASGIGYEVITPITDLQQMPLNGNKILLYTHLQVKEDGIALFGFLSEEALQVFKLLITVSGIGPKGAISILSGISINDLRFAVLAEDTKTISKIPGIGVKTAGKLILELKDKFKLQDTIETKWVQNGNAVAKSSIAIKREFKKDESDFLNVVAFGKTAEAMAQYLTKGSKVAITGRIQTGSYEAQDGTKRYTTDLVVEAFEFLDSKKAEKTYEKEDSTMRSIFGDGTEEPEDYGVMPF